MKPLALDDRWKWPEPAWPSPSLSSLRAPADYARAQLWRHRVIKAADSADFEDEKERPAIAPARTWYGWPKSWGPTATGFAGEVRLRGGKAGRLSQGEKLEKARRTLAEHLDSPWHSVADVRVRPIKGSAGRARVSVVRRDPFDSPVPLAWPRGRYAGMWEGLPFGVDEEGAVVNLPLAGSHLLVAGETGSGKSVALSVIMAAAALDPRVRIWLMDGSALDLVLWKDVAADFVGINADETDKQTHARAVRTLGMVNEEMKRRLHSLQGTARKVPRGGPLDLVVCDEFPYFAQSQEFVERFKQIAARGRKAGIMLVLTCQRAEAAIMSGTLRTNLPLRVGFRCDNVDTSKMVLGGDHATGEFDCSTIPSDDNHRGVAFYNIEGRGTERIKGFYLDEDAIADIVAEGVARRQPPRPVMRRPVPESDGAVVLHLPAGKPEKVSATVVLDGLVPRSRHDKEHKKPSGGVKTKWEDALIPALEDLNLPRSVHASVKAVSYYRTAARRDKVNFGPTVDAAAGDALQWVNVIPEDTDTYYEFDWTWEKDADGRERTELAIELQPATAGERVAA